MPVETPWEPELLLAAGRGAARSSSNTVFDGALLKRSWERTGSARL